MLKNRLFNGLIVASLLVMAALLVYQTIAFANTSALAPGQNLFAAGQTAAAACPYPAEDIRTIHAVYLKDIGIWLPTTAQAMTGLNGGLTELRNCAAPGK